MDDTDPRATAPSSTQILDADKVKLLTFRCPRVVGDPRSSGFRTDGDIARPDRNLAGRKLEAVDNSWLSAPKIKNQPARQTPGKKWDQFEANARLFGTKVRIRREPLHDGARRVGAHAAAAGRRREDRAGDRGRADGQRPSRRGARPGHRGYEGRGGSV